MSTELVSSVGSVGLVEERVSSHPLSPLTASEITNTSALVQSLYPKGTSLQYKSITLQEPAKSQLVPYLDAEYSGVILPSIERRAFVSYYIRNTVRLSTRIPHPRRTLSN